MMYLHKKIRKVKIKSTNKIKYDQKKTAMWLSYKFLLDPN